MAGQAEEEEEVREPSMMWAILRGAMLGFSTAMLTFSFLQLLPLLKRKSVFGKMLSREELMHHFNENLHKYTDVDGDLIHNLEKGVGHFIAKMPRNRKAKYYIHGVGQIPRTSAYTFLIDQRFKQKHEETN